MEERGCAGNLREVRPLKKPAPTKKPAPPAPPAPTNLTLLVTNVTPTDATVKLEWTAPVNTVSSPITDYLVSTDNTTYISLNSVNTDVELDFSILGITVAGSVSTQIFYIKAKNNNGISPFVSVTLTGFTPGVFPNAGGANALKAAIDGYLGTPVQKEAVLKAYYNIENWNVTQVTNMSEAFKNGRPGTGTFGALDSTNFNDDISGWNIINVTNMSSMFEGAAAFNQDLEWSISGNLTSLASMFQDATSFNGTLNFTSSGVNQCDCKKMFFGASSFTGGGLAGWQGNGLVKRIGNLDSMFKNAVAFNADLTGWRFYGTSGTAVHVSGNDLNSIFDGASALTSGSLSYSGTGTSTELSWTDLADYVYSLRIRDGDGAIPNFYANGEGYDGTPSTALQYPTITAGTLASFISVIDSNANAVKVDYTLDQTITAGTITFTRTSGESDGSSPHVVNLAGAELTQGSFSGVLTNAPTLVVDAIYNLTFTITGGASRTFTGIIPFGQFNKVGDDYWLGQYGPETQAMTTLSQSLIDNMAAAYNAGKTVQMKFVDGTPITENGSTPTALSVYQAFTYSDLTVNGVGSTGVNTTIQFSTNPFNSFQNLKSGDIKS